MHMSSTAQTMYDDGKVEIIDKVEAVRMVEYLGASPLVGRSCGETRRQGGPVSAPCLASSGTVGKHISIKGRSPMFAFISSRITEYNSL